MKVKIEHLPENLPSPVEKMWWNNSNQMYVIMGQYGEVIWVAHWDGMSARVNSIGFSADMLEKTNG